MTSPYLTRPTRPQADVFRDMLAKLPETYVPVSMNGGQLEFYDTKFCQTRREIVFDIANGQYDHKVGGIWETALVAVFRLIHDEKPENVTFEVARAVLEYIKLHEHLSHDAHGYLIDQPFLDEHLPDWRKSVRPGRVDREYEGAA